MLVTNFFILFDMKTKKILIVDDNNEIRELVIVIIDD